MAEESEGSITRWMGDLRAGNLAAAQPIWERYFDQLLRLAGGRLRALGRTSADADEEDAVLSAFDTFCAGVTRGRFPQLAHRDDLWRLLVVITARKVQAQTRRSRRQKRGGDRVRNATDLFDDRAEGAGDGLDRIVGNEPTPEFAAQVTEEFWHLLDILGDDSLRMIALGRMKGYTEDEIADRLGCSSRTVARRLDLIRKAWLTYID